MDTAGKGPPQANHWVIALTVMVGNLMAAVDHSIVNTALPTMMGNLGASVDGIAWVSTGYLISVAVVMPINAWLGGFFGRKRFYLFCIALFTIGSLLCGAAWSLGSLIAFRVLQGIGAGALVPTAQAVLRESFPPREQGMAMALYGIGVMVGPAFGPTLGGWITDHWGWPWIFYVNLPLGLLALVMVWQVIHDPPYLTGRSRRIDQIDLIGLGLLAVGMASVVVVLQQGERQDWFESSLIVRLSLVAAVALVAFVIRSLKVVHPVVDLRILKDLTLSIASVIVAVLAMGIFSGSFISPLFFQQLLGFSATQSGLALLPRTFGVMAFLPIGGRLYNYLDARLIVSGGVIIAGVGFVQMSRLTLETGYSALFWPQFIQGAGIGLTFATLSTAALSTVERSRMMVATGLYNLVRQLGGSFGVAISATLLQRSAQIYRAALVAHVSPFDPEAVSRLGGLTARLVGRGIDPWTARQQALALTQRTVDTQAHLLAFADGFRYIFFLFLAMAPLTLLLRRGRGETVAPQLE